MAYNRNTIIIILLSIILFLILKYGGEVFINFLWFRELGYTEVYAKIIIYKLGVCLVCSIAFFIIFYLNFLLIKHFTPRIVRVSESNVVEIIDKGIFEKKFNHWLILLLIICSVLIGGTAIKVWPEFVNFLYGDKWGVSDPIFNKDLSFYMFRLPFLEFVYNQALLWVIILVVTAFSIYNFYRLIRFNPFQIAPKVKLHLSLLVACFFGVMVLGFKLKIYNLLFHKTPLLTGISYTDYYARIIAYKILMILSLVCSILFILNYFFKRAKILVGAIIIYAIVFMFMGGVYPVALEQLKVKPNELTLEKQFLNFHIQSTLQAYGLDNVTIKELSLEEKLSSRLLNQHKDDLLNIRLWDQEPLKKTYAQLQEIRTYYEFADVDVDRYSTNFGGYKQVMLSARELSWEQLPTKEWINLHLTYTHGYGVCVSEVSGFTKEGLPLFLVKDIPPVSEEPSLKIDYPQIYYGELTDSFCIVNTNLPEFDYPYGGENRYTHYQGRGGITLSNLAMKFLFTICLGEPNILLNKDITSKSKIMLWRKIDKRVKKLFPLIDYSSDPYIVISEGRIYWLIDGYVSSSHYPYSLPYSEQGENYIINLVKVTIDAYTGEVNYYLVNSNNPWSRLYLKAFGGIFKPIKEMPPSLLSHIRYPEELFYIQSSIYSIYHMENPQIFYNKEDLWNIPQEIFGNTPKEMKPYYTIMKFPWGGEREFILLLPFTTYNKNNLSSLFCVRNDKANYGELVVFKFPKKKLVYGPMQIEARIDQDPEISKQLSLWSQRGSDIIRGNLLIIPVENTLLYIEPLYLIAAKGALPELKRIILAYEDRVIMESNLLSALNKLTEGLFIPATSGDIKETDKKEYYLQQIQECLKDLQSSKQFLKDFNWAEFGKHLEKLENRLKKILKESCNN